MLPKFRKRLYDHCIREAQDLLFASKGNGDEQQWRQLQELLEQWSMRNTQAHVQHGVTSQEPDMEEIGSMDAVLQDTNTGMMASHTLLCLATWSLEST